MVKKSTTDGYVLQVGQSYLRLTHISGYKAPDDRKAYATDSSR